MSPDEIPFPSNRPSISRMLSAFELLIGAAIVIGHNVFRLVPNEVPILVVLGLISIWRRDRTWSAIGFKRPSSWRRIIVIAIAAAALRIVLGEFVVEPITGFFWPAPVAPAMASEIKGNVTMALVALAIVWTFAAFGEEIGYRGYLLTRAADAGGRSTAAWWIGVIIVSVLFGTVTIIRVRQASWIQESPARSWESHTWSPAVIFGPAFSHTG